MLGLVGLRMFKAFKYISVANTYTAFPCMYNPLFTRPNSPFPRSSFSTIVSESKISSGLIQLVVFVIAVRDSS